MYLEYEKNLRTVSIFFAEKLLEFLLNSFLVQKRCHVNISSKTQDMMENMAEETVKAHLATTKVIRKTDFKFIIHPMLLTLHFCRIRMMKLMIFSRVIPINNCPPCFLIEIIVPNVTWR